MIQLEWNQDLWLGLVWNCFSILNNPSKNYDVIDGWTQYMYYK